MKLDWDDGRVVLERYARINQLLNKSVYTDEDKSEIKDLLRKLGLAKKDDGGRYAELRQVRGRLLRCPKGGGLEIIAAGRPSWIGWVELKSLRDTLYVEELIGPETISTMTEDTIRAFQDHGRVDLTLESDLEEAQHLFNQLYAAGVDYNVVVATLEREGIERFLTSFNELMKGIADRRQRLVRRPSAVPGSPRTLSS